MRKILFFTVALILVSISKLIAQTGSLDPSFGNGGKVITSTINGREGASGMAIQSDGKVVAVGYKLPNTANTSLVGRILRYNTDGTLDNSFGVNGIVTASFDCDITSVAIQADAKILVCGYFGGSSDYNAFIARYKVNGDLDYAFGASGLVLSKMYPIWDIAIQSDGKIIGVGNMYDNSLGMEVSSVARYNSNGTIDSAFGINGVVGTTVGMYEGFNSVAIQNDGRIVADGSFLARYNTNGSLDGTFGSNGIVTTNLGGGLNDGVAFQNDGKIIEFGSDFRLTRYNINGTLDFGFGNNGTIVPPFGSATTSAQSITLQNDGKIIVAGSSGSAQNECFTLVRYNNDGSLDNSFDGDGKVITCLNPGPSRAFTVRLFGTRICLAGHVYPGSYDYRWALTAYYNDAFPQFAINQTLGNYIVGSGSAPNIDGSSFIGLRKSNGELCAEVNAKGTNLGSTQWGERIYSGTDIQNTYGWFGGSTKQFGGFMNRNLYISPASQPASATTVRIYCTPQDINNFLTAFNTQYGASKTINDIRILKYNGANVDLDRTNNVDVSSAYTSITPTFIGSYGESQEFRFFEFPVSSYSEFWIALTSSNAPLPLKLLSFSGQIANKKVILNWQTVQEQNASHFVLERSTDGVGFIPIGTVKAAGNTAFNQSYSFTDEQPWSDRNYYRLKMADLDGKFTYSSTLQLIPSRQSSGLAIYPNPASEQVYVKLSEVRENCVLELYDASGRKLKEQKVYASSASTIVIDIKPLAKGLYQFVLKKTEGIETTVFLKE